MRYLISEVEFYKPTVKQFEEKVVVIRRDQLEGEKLYIAPKSLMEVAASFSSDENSVSIPNFADIVIYLRAINASFSFDSATSSISIMSDEESISLIYINGKFLMEVAEFGPSARSLYDFMDSLGLHIMVATTLPKTVNLNEDLESEPESVEEEKPVEEPKDDGISKEEREAIINDSKDPEEKEVKVDVVDTVEEMLDK